MSCRSTKISNSQGLENTKKINALSEMNNTVKTKQQLGTRTISNFQHVAE
jgi:hypothetical protein